MNVGQTVTTEFPNRDRDEVSDATPPPCEVSGTITAVFPEHDGPVFHVRLDCDGRTVSRLSGDLAVTR